MKNGHIFSLVLAICVLTLAGCGGGGGGGSSASPAATTTISGVASKGMFKSGKVKVYAVNADGTKGNLLTTGDISPDGTYTVVVEYTGPVLIEAYGDYMDEATLQIKTVPEQTPLRAALEKVEGEVKVAVTPLTEIAVKKLEDPTNKKIAVTNIEETNTLISQVFHVADIINTIPVDPTAAAPAGAKQEQKEYALALAAISEMLATPANNGKSLDSVITEVEDAIVVDSSSPASTPTISTQTAIAFQEALQTFVADQDKNKTGITDATATSLVNVGGSTATIKLKTTGSGSMNGIQVSVTLPAGVTVKAESGKPLSGLVSASGAVSGGSLLETRYVPASANPGQLIIALASKDSFGAGEFATIKCDVAPGVTISSSSFTPASYTNSKVVDGTGAPVSNMSYTAEVL